MYDSANAAASLETYKGTPKRKAQSNAQRNALMQDKQYDRAAQDIGNIINLGHVNVRISDQHIATHYYVTGLGLSAIRSSIPAPAICGSMSA